MSDRKSQYSELLRDPRWQKLRLQVMERDNWTCQFCGDTKKTLNVHHLRYFYGRKPWDYPLHFLVTLCEDCHEVETDEKKDALNDLQTALAHKSAHARDIYALVQLIDRLPAGADIHSIFSALGELVSSDRFNRLLNYSENRESTTCDLRSVLDHRIPPIPPSVSGDFSWDD